MDTIAELCQRNHGIVTTAQLLEAGYASHLTALVRSGRLLRIRNGWYASPDAHRDLVRAVRVGGRLAGTSAAAWYGLATPERFALHVQVRQNASRLRAPTNRWAPLAASPDGRTVIHWRGSEVLPSSSNVIVSLGECLRQVIMTEHEDDAVACLDSALRNQRLDQIDLEMLRRSLPARYRGIIDLADGRSDGYPESVARRRLARAGIPTQLQVKILDERWVDILVGDRLALEIDGRGKYLIDRDPEKIVKRFAEEKKRDAFLFALGLIVIHVTYDMVVHDWEATLSMILAVMERGDHLHRRKSRTGMPVPGESRSTRRAAISKS